MKKYLVEEDHITRLKFYVEANNEAEARAIVQDDRLWIDADEEGTEYLGTQVFLLGS